MKFLLNCKNYRGLRSADFEPEGVCALIGANGSGKTSLLSALQLMNSLFLRTTQSAIALDGGHWGLVNLNSGADALDLLLNLDGQEWHVHLAPLASCGYFLHEHVRNGQGEDLLKRVGTDNSRMTYDGVELPRGEGTFLKLAWDLRHDPAIADLVNLIQNIRIYGHYRLSQLREQGSRADSAIRVSRDGDNVFAVLRNWRDQRSLKGSYEFVVESLRAAFPDYFEDFEFYGDAQSVRAKVYLHGISEAMPVAFIPDGLLFAVLHLAAAAGAPERSIVGIDDFENYLHPFAIQSLIESIRDLAAQRDLCVLITTHSPVVLDEFRSEPNRVFVMDSAPPNKPIRLDLLRDTEWLAHYSLGDLYSRFEFGARLPSTMIE